MTNDVEAWQVCVVNGILAPMRHYITAFPVGFAPERHDVDSDGYGFRVRLLYKPFEGRDDVLREFREWRGGL